MLVQFLGFLILFLDDGIDAFDQHQAADDAEEENVGKLDRQIDLANGAKDLE